MKNKRIVQIPLSTLIGLLAVLLTCFTFTACEEEEQLDEVIQDKTNEDKDKEITPLPGLPDYTAGYDSWLKLNAEPIPPVVGSDPHRGTKNVYVNQTRDTIAPDDEQQFPFPDGSIVVKEAYRPDKDYVGLIAIMRKVAGSDPDHNDWEFIEYTRNDPDAQFTVLASGRICWGCHVRVEDIDYVFTELD